MKNKKFTLNNFISENLKLSKRLTALLLALVILASAVITTVTFADDANAANYPALRGYSNGIPDSSTKWTYGIKDFAILPELSVSTVGFSSPTALWDANESKATVSWNAVANASAYVIKIYDGTNLILSEEVAETNYTTAANLLTGGGVYRIQITVKTPDTVTTASDVCIFTADAAVTNNTYSFTGNNEDILYVDKISGKKIINESIGVGYTLTNTTTARTVVFESKSNTGKNYGSHMRFTAPENGLYDFAGSLFVTGNTSVEATLYYRIVKIDAENKLTVLSGEDWLSLDVTSTDYNPKAVFPAVDASLQNGESVAIEVYHESSVDNTTLNVCLGNPTATKVTPEETYKGATTTYAFKDYSADVVYDAGGSSNGKFTPLNGRWSSRPLLYENSTTQYGDFNWMRNTASWMLLYANGFKTGATPGYHYGTSNKHNVVVGHNAGVAFEFTSPKSAYATISVQIANNYVLDTIYYRILKNSTTVYPQNTAWELVPKNGATLTASVEVDKDDTFSIEFYSPANANPKCLIASPPKVTLIDNNANALNSNTFSPLWERPYNGKDYNGTITVPNGAVFDFNLYKVEDGTIHNTDYYNSAEKLLYKNGVANCGYVFGDEQLKFRFGDSTYGMSLDFIVPERGNYDLSLLLNTLTGEGEVFVRLLKEDKTLFPSSGEWYSYTEQNGRFDSLEFSADMNEKITLQIYSTANEGSEPITVGLGSVILQKLNNRVYTATGNKTVYRPNDYTAFEDGYIGTFLQSTSRFEYFFGGSAPDKTDVASQKLSNQNGSVSFTQDGETVVNALGTTEAQIVFTSPMKGDGTLELILDTLPTGATVSVYKNDAAVFDWTATPPETTDISLEKGDKLYIKLKGLNGSNIKFGGINISLVGPHNNANAPEDDGFYAVYANPYGEEFYIGDYEKTDVSYWSFDFYDVKNSQIVSADKYDAEQNKKLYSSLFNTAYYFGANNITADLNCISADENYGLALGFTAPKDDTFNTRFGLNLVSLENSQTTATLNVRMIKKSSLGETADEQIWPASGWHTQTVNLKEDVTIPYIETTLKKGETVYLQISATDCTGKVGVNLVSPAVLKETVVEIVTEDISARMYRAFDYCPYSHIQGYRGSYVPMDNRWNFYFADVNSQTLELQKKPAVTVNTALSSSDQIYLNQYRAPLFKWNPNSKAVDTVLEVTDNNNIGAIMQFTAPVTGEVVFSAPLSILDAVINTAELHYRVVSYSAEDGSSKQIWPSNTNEWETLSGENSLSGCLDIALDVNMGDKFELQTYWTADSTQIAEYVAANDKNWQPSYSLPASFTVIDEINSGRSKFNAGEQFMGEYLLNPFWRVKYSMDSNNPVWKSATLYKWRNWLAASPSNIGISNGSLYWIENDAENGFSETADPSVAWEFTVRRNGTFKYGSSTSIYLGRETTEGYNAETRITLNGETVWPSSGWQTVVPDERIKIKDLSFTVEEGDIIRFEARADKNILSGEQMYLVWIPVFTITDDIDIYNRSKDIYNMLDGEMFALFKSLPTDTEFDPDLAANKLLSEKIKKEKENIVKFEYFTDSEKSSEQELPPVEETVVESHGSNENADDEYSEWTETVVKPGGKWKKVIRRYVTPWWVIALIIVGALAAVGGITVVIIIVVKKRKSKKLTTLNKEETE